MQNEHNNELQRIHLGESSIPVNVGLVGAQVSTVIITSLAKYAVNLFTLGITSVVIEFQKTKLQIRLLKKHNELACEIALLEDLANQLDEAYQRARNRNFHDPSGRERLMARLTTLETAFAAHIDKQLAAALN